MEFPNAFKIQCDVEYALRNNCRIRSSILKLHPAFHKKLENKNYSLKKELEHENFALKKKLEQEIVALERKGKTSKKDALLRKKLQQELAALEKKEKITKRVVSPPMKEEKKGEIKKWSNTGECRIKYDSKKEDPPDMRNTDVLDAENFWEYMSKFFKCIETSPKRKKHRKKYKERYNGRKSSKSKNAEKNGDNNTNLCDILEAKFMKTFKKEDQDANHFLQSPPNFVARNRLGFFESLEMPPLIF